MKKKLTTIIISIAMAAMMSVTAFAGQSNSGITTMSLSYSSSSSTWTTVTDSSDKSTCWTLAQKVVKDRLKAPSTAKFPGYTTASIKKSGDRYQIKAWVDAQNSFGATLRSNFTVILKKTGSGKNASWSLESCVID